MKQIGVILFLPLLFCCGNIFHSQKVDEKIIVDTATTIATRFIPPAGYERKPAADNSFEKYLRNLKLLPVGTDVKTYNGNIASTNSYNAAVIDISIGTQDLQQCADAVMRLRSEYLWKANNKEKIAFHFTNGMLCKYSEYASGYRFVNEKTWEKKSGQDTSYKAFQNYLKLVFMYAGTLSLEKELTKVSELENIQIGDVFIKGGSPGHCFIVVDVVQNQEGKQMMLLAESYMPAQNIHIITNSDNPWIAINSNPAVGYGNLISSKYHKRFKD